MPVVILLDISLSMMLPLVKTTPAIKLAVKGINSLINFVKKESRCDRVALLTFASLWEIKSPFTRNYDEVITALGNVKEQFDKSFIYAGLQGAQQVVLEEFNCSTFVQIIVVGDGIYLQELQGPDSNVQFPFPFPCSLHFVCLNPSPSPLLANLVARNGGRGRVWQPASVCQDRDITALFDDVAKSVLTPLGGQLSFGNLSSDVIIIPLLLKVVSLKIKIVGFLDHSSLAMPGIASKHMIIAATNSQNQGEDHLRTPSFCALLHGALVTQSKDGNPLAALVKLDCAETNKTFEDWYGFVVTSSEKTSGEGGKRKSNLVLCVLPKGRECVPWLGDMTKLNPVCNDDVPTGTFPVMSRGAAKSYKSLPIVWLYDQGLQADVSKLLRCVRKLPEKKEAFLKEVQRIDTAARILSFDHLLLALSKILERELLSAASQSASAFITQAIETFKSTANDIS